MARELIRVLQALAISSFTKQGQDEHNIDESVPMVSLLLKYVLEYVHAYVLEYVHVYSSTLGEYVHAYVD